MIEKVAQFLLNIRADTSVMARMEKCIEENEELVDAFMSNNDDALIKEAADRIITGYALLLSLGGSEETVIAKMSEVESRPEYQGVRG
jgi:phosphoribosyl-ATP pyrophosphohydrolase